MTYSRPGNGSVNVSSGTSSARVPNVTINGDSKVSKSFRTTKFDKVSPDLIYQNGLKKVQQIDKFVNFFTDDVVPFVGKELDRRAENEVGAFLANVDPEEVTAKGNQKNIDAMNSLSYRAKDILIGVQGTQATAMYPAALQAAYASNSKVLTPGNSPEAKEIRAIAKAEAKAQAMEAVGLNKLPAYQTAVNAESLANAEGQVNGQLFQKQIAQEAVLRQNTLVNAGAVDLSKSFKNIQTAAATVEEGREVETTGTRAYLESIVAKSGQTEGVVIQARLLAGVITRAQGELSPTEYAKLLSDLKVQKNTPLYGVDKNTNLWDFPINDNGDTIGTSLDKWEDNAIAAADEQIYQETAAAMQQRIINGDVAGAFAILRSASGLINDPKLWNSLASLHSSGQTLVTPEMTTRQNDIDAMVLDGKTTYEKEIKSILAGEPGQVSKAWLESRLRLAQKEVETGAASAPPNAAALKAYAAQEQSSVSQEQRQYFDDKVLSLPGNTSGGKTTSDGYKALKEAADLKRDYFAEIYAEKQAKGEPIDPFKVAEEAQNRALAEIARRQKNNDTEGPVNPAQQFQEFHQGVQKELNQAARSGNGKVTVPIEAISQQQRDKLKAAGISWDSLSDKKKEAELIASFVNKIEMKGGKPVPITQQRARQIATDMLQGARQYAEKNPAPGIPRTVPVTEQEIQQTRSGAEISGLESLPGYQATVDTTLNILGSVKDFLMQDKVGFGKEKDNGEAIRQWFNNDGMGDQSMKYVDGFLNMIAGVQPATAAPLMYGTPDGLADFRQAWKYGSQGLKTGPLPQVSATAQARPVPTAVGNDQHELFVMIGVSEGTRTANGGYTKAYYGHSDPGDGNYNRGTVSGGRGTSASPEMVDQQWMGRLTNLQQRMRPQLIVMGLLPGTQGYNRVMFNLMDLEVQSPAANQSFAGKLFGTVREAGFTIEAIAKARADSFINPATGRLDAGGFGNNYQTLIKDQRSRAGVYDYRRRL